MGVSDDGAVGQVSETVGRLTEAAAARQGLPPVLLADYLSMLVAVAGTGRRLAAEEEAACRARGAEAVALGVGLPQLVDLHMSAARRLWPKLPGLVGSARGRAVRAGELVGIGEAVWRAADAALSALTAGYVEAQRLVVRREEAARREFVEDLLTGHAPVASLIERAEPFGLRLTAGHLVAVLQPDRTLDAGSGLVGAVEDAARRRFAGLGLLVAVREGRLVCVLASSPAAAGDGGRPLGQSLAGLAGASLVEWGTTSAWRAGVGRLHAGPRGVQWSYQEALEALDLAVRLDLAPQVVHASDLLVYRVLARDETALADLVGTVLEPLTAARGGAEPLVRTLEAYFAAGRNAAETGRALHLSVRAVTYRLQRVAALTGYSPADPQHHLPLLVAVTGARLLDWPQRPLLRE